MAAPPDGAGDTEILRRSAGQPGRPGMDLFGVLYERHYPNWYRYARSILWQHPSRAEDAVHTAVLRLIEKRGTMPEGHSFRPWAAKFVQLASLEELGRRTQASLPQSEDESPASAESGPATRILQRDRERQLQEALHTLPENERQAFTLRRVARLSASEAAAEMQVPERTLRDWVAKAAARLAEALADPGEASSQGDAPARARAGGPP